MRDLGSDHAVFGISVTSELTGVQPQALRDYEARGLLDPHRTAGGTRRYSTSDVELVNRIATLLASGLNLAGARRVLELEAETAQLRAEVNSLRKRRVNASDQPL
ncbi:MAG: MerR family transcriptional regulator [Nocardioidaceae bacterium]|nr:MerR family transcriptional regulator [Nocardioidaceae bacterium]